MTGEVQAALTRDRAKILWCVHVLGPDELHAMPSYDAAEQNVRDLIATLYTPKMIALDVMCLPIVAPWPYSADAHRAEVAKSWPSSGAERPVCERCGEEDSDTRIKGKVDTCQMCVASDAYRIEQLTWILRRWATSYAAHGASREERQNRERDLWAACENAGIKPSTHEASKAGGGT